MNIFPCSDTHFEWWNSYSIFDTIPKDIDVLVLAGDIGSGGGVTRGLKHACDAFPDAQVVYICGNHDIWDCSPRDIDRLLGYFNRDNLHFLNRSGVEIDGVPFIGCTLWFEYRDDNFMYSNMLADFHKIDDFVTWVYDENKRCLEYLMNNATEDTVVVTHHAPSEYSVADHLLGSPANRFFVCEACEAIMDRCEIPVWVHGHTHNHSDYIYNDTRVVCNPVGYPMEKKQMFDPTKIISI